ncbi:hypothetical protein ANO11243_094030 [Dothideomycetidae sp. 11243]|nr:hypothetical protein ANO11243_094030 [fungal sp. No.11243]
MTVSHYLLLSPYAGWYPEETWENLLGALIRNNSSPLTDSVPDRLFAYSERPALETTFEGFIRNPNDYRIERGLSHIEGLGDLHTQSVADSPVDLRGRLILIKQLPQYPRFPQTLLEDANVQSKLLRWQKEGFGLEPSENIVLLVVGVLLCQRVEQTPTKTRSLGATREPGDRGIETLPLESETSHAEIPVHKASVFALELKKVLLTNKRRSPRTLSSDVTGDKILHATTEDLSEQDWSQVKIGKIRSDQRSATRTGQKAQAKSRIDVAENLSLMIRSERERQSNALVLVKSGDNFEVSTTNAYALRMWPLIGQGLLGWLKVIVGDHRKSDGTSNVEQTTVRLRDKTRVSGAIRNNTSSPELIVEVNGRPKSVADTCELLAWISSALRSSFSKEITICKPKVNDQDRGTASEVLAKPSIYIAVTHTLEAAFTPHDQRDGTCWRELFNNPVVVEGFPVRDRPNGLPGLESSLEIIAALLDTQHITTYKGCPFFKCPSAVMYPIKKQGTFLVWHLLVAEDGQRIEYSDQKIANTFASRDISHVQDGAAGTTKQVDTSELNQYRHIFGWCREACSLVGTADSHVKYAFRKIPNPKVALTGFGISGGYKVTFTATFAVGLKDKSLRPAFLEQYGQQTNYIDQVPFLFYDPEEKRGWLVDGSSALLHLTRASIAQDVETRHFSLPEYTESSESTTEREKVRRFLTADRDLVLFENGSTFEDTVVTQNGIRQASSPQTISKYRFSDRVGEICRKVELIRAYLADKRDKDGIGYQVRASPRHQLFGFNFWEVATATGSFNARVATLKAIGRGWIDLVRAVDAIVIFGTNYGELLSPAQPEIICKRWRTLPTHQHFVAVSMQVIKDLTRLNLRRTLEQPLILAEHVYWHKPASVLCFNPCQCTGRPYCDRVQVLCPRTVLGARVRLHSPPELDCPESQCSEGAVIFGHSLKWPLSFLDALSDKSKRVSCKRKSGPVAEDDESDTSSERSQSTSDSSSTNHEDAETLFARSIQRLQIMAKRLKTTNRGTEREMVVCDQR